ncbi:MAG: NifU family protein [Bacteroidia bacterium]|nr:NifU family protein [Bacteroidia bacterium]
MEKRKIKLHTETTPNPNSIKFIANILINAHTPAEYTADSDYSESPLAQKLFNYPFVTSVFLWKDYITITKSEALEWDGILTELRDFITDYLAQWLPIFTDARTQLNDFNSSNKETIPFLNKTDIEICNVLDTYISPAIERDGGSVEFKSFKNGIVTVALKGSCSGCPAASITLKVGIEALLKRMVPEVQSVVAEKM